MLNKKLLKKATCFVVAGTLLSGSLFVGNSFTAYASELNTGGGTPGITQEVENTVPNILSLTVSDKTNVTIKWDGVSNAIGYDILRSIDGGENWEVINTVLSDGVRATHEFTDTNLKYNTTYEYKIRAYGYNSNGLFKKISEIKTVKTEGISAPIITSITANEKGINIKWNAVEGAVKYEVYRLKSGNSNYVKMYTTSSTNYTNTNPDSYTKYYYKVRAIGTGTNNISEFSKIYSKYSYLKTPSPWLNERSHNYIKLQWSKVPNATHYKVYRWNGSIWDYQGQTTGTTYKNYYNMKPATKYTYKVKAYRIVNGKTLAISGTKEYATASKLKATSAITITDRSANMVKFKWNKIDGATKYKVFLTRDGKPAWKIYEGSKTSLKIPDMYSSKNYRVIVYGYKYINGKWVPSVGKSRTILKYTGNNFSRLGLDAQVFLDNLKKHENDKFYRGTPYRSVTQLRSEYNLTVPNGYNTSRTKAMNCAGFVAAAMKDAGADMSKVRMYGGTGGAANTVNWVKFFKSYTKVYKYSSMNSLLKSGRAEKGDIICRIPYSYSYNRDYHMAIFWGNTSSQNKVWHSTREGGYYSNVISKMPSANFSATYYLVKLRK